MIMNCLSDLPTMAGCDRRSLSFCFSSFYMECPNVCIWAKGHCHAGVDTPTPVQLGKCYRRIRIPGTDFLTPSKGGENRYYILISAKRQKSVIYLTSQLRQDVLLRRKVVFKFLCMCKFFFFFLWVAHTHAYEPKTKIAQFMRPLPHWRRYYTEIISLLSL